MVAAFGHRFGDYLVLIFLPLVLVWAIPGIRKYRNERKERDEWLKDDITRHREWRLLTNRCALQQQPEHLARVVAVVVPPGVLVQVTL